MSEPRKNKLGDFYAEVVGPIARTLKEPPRLEDRENLASRVFWEIVMEFDESVQMPIVLRYEAMLGFKEMGKRLYNTKHHKIGVKGSAARPQFIGAMTNVLDEINNLHKWNLRIDYESGRVL